MSDEPKQPKAIGTGRSGRVRSALRAVVNEARASGRMTLEHELRAIIAERQAALCDDYAALGKGAEMLKASDSLLELLDTLPVRGTSTGGEEDPGSDGTSERGKLLTLMDSPPALGNASHS